MLTKYILNKNSGKKSLIYKINKVNLVRVCSLIMFVLIVGLYCYQLVKAQSPKEPVKAAKYKNIKWYMVSQIEIKPGKRNELLGIVKKYFEPASKKVGNGPVMVLEHRTGPWDITTVWPLKEGLSTLQWKESPDDVAWYKELVKMAGSEAKAKELRKKYVSDIARETSYLTFEEKAFENTGGK
ncbi:MAG TPA: hypothetical protein VKA34_17390 [Balneolales bacterium]|nr:hypothetical protein [Balneolales bacterium]